MLVTYLSQAVLLYFNYVCKNSIYKVMIPVTSYFIVKPLWQLVKPVCLC